MVRLVRVVQVVQVVREGPGGPGCQWGPGGQGCTGGPGGPGGPGCQYVIGSYSNRKLEALIRGLSIIPCMYILIVLQWSNDEFYKWIRKRKLWLFLPGVTPFQSRNKISAKKWPYGNLDFFHLRRLLLFARLSYYFIPCLRLTKFP